MRQRHRLLEAEATPNARPVCRRAAFQGHRLLEAGGPSLSLSLSLSLLLEAGPNETGGGRASQDTVKSRDAHRSTARLTDS